MKNPEKILSQYNSIFKENDEIYRSAAKMLGLPDCAFWILYSLRESKNMLTQSEVCRLIYQPKQTVNSSLKKLESDGYIEFCEKKDRRRKEIKLTAKGLQLAENTADKVISAEKNAFSQLTEEEGELFIKIFRKYTDSLKNNILDIKNEVKGSI